MYNLNNKSQFGIVDGSAIVNTDPNIRISLGKQLTEKMIIDEEEVIINLTLDECNRLCDVLKIVENSLKVLITLSEKNKLKEDAYLFER